jgi:hypothetical protein
VENARSGTAIIAAIVASKHRRKVERTATFLCDHRLRAAQIPKYISRDGVTFRSQVNLLSVRPLRVLLKSDQTEPWAAVAGAVADAVDVARHDGAFGSGIPRIGANAFAFIQRYSKKGLIQQRLERP